jgi:hypothetical protein
MKVREEEGQGAKTKKQEQQLFRRINKLKGEVAGENWKTQTQAKRLARRKSDEIATNEATGQTRTQDLAELERTGANLRGGGKDYTRKAEEAWQYR